jgi:hypothetical protein
MRLQGEGGAAYYASCQRQLKQLTGLCLETTPPLSPVRLQDLSYLMWRIKLLAWQMQNSLDYEIADRERQDAPTR